MVGSTGGRRKWSDDLDAEEDPLFEQALSIVRQQGTASASMLQRRLRVGYNRAARLIEHMETRGSLGPLRWNSGSARSCRRGMRHCPKETIVRVRHARLAPA